MTPQENIQHIWGAPLAFMFEHRIPVSETSQTTSNSIDLRLVYISDWDMLAWGFISLLNSHCLRSFSEASFEGESGLPWSFGVWPALQKSEEQGAEDGWLLGVQLSVRHLKHDSWAKSEQLRILYGALQV